MKKFAAIFMILVLAFSVFGCGKKEKAAPDAPLGKTTLMVYMVGSDLEAKSGNATKDLEEMAESGIDLANANVVVYAGGSPKWHNDVMGEQQNAVLKLTGNGFETVSSMPEASMGDSKTLADFLNYAHKNYPADNFALILWNHGNGPVIGYGKDMVYENDSLTLKEMQTALEQSPFSAENKLKWVGFDACLMASAELACVFDSYADYLVASQEIEPHFGWDYSFLKELTTTASPAILETITNKYHTTCEEYFADKGYSGRETTLSVMDLSKAQAVETAINALFAKAEPDVPMNYNGFASKRVDTRALGRASTGSEYDLIDINDMAEKLSEVYPEEAEALKKAISDMVLVNKTNTTGLCGVSIYYPFYNKSRYESEWSTAYEELNMFADYRSYLQAYSQIWLGDDFLANASSVMPSMGAQGVYNLELTPEQEETYADAQFMIMQRMGNDLYAPLFVNSNVKKEGNNLTVNFDGNVIYAKDKFNNYIIPTYREHDSVGDVSHYSLVTTASTPQSLEFQLKYTERKHESVRFHFAVNNATKNIDVSALTTYDEEVSAETLMSGKTPEPDLSQYSEYNFMGWGYYWITRYDNGAIKPLEEWSKTDFYYANTLSIANDVEFVFAPLVTGEYYFIYQIKDTQGNQYCSDIMPINVNGKLPDPIIPEPVSVNWTSGDSVNLGNYSGVDVSMKLIDDALGGKRYALVCRNNNNFAVDFEAKDMFVNGNIFCDDVYLTKPTELDTETFKDKDPFINPGETVIIDPEGIDFGNAVDADKIKSIQSMSFTVEVSRADNRETLVYEQKINVNVNASHNISFAETEMFRSDYDFPSRGLFATEHQIYTDDSLSVSITGLGYGCSEPDKWGFSDTAEDVADGPLYCMFGFENRSTQSQWVQIVALVFDGVTVPAASSQLKVPAGCSVYDSVYISDDELDMYGITSASKVEVVIRKATFMFGPGGFSQYLRAPVRLAQSGAPVSFNHSSKVLLNENGVKVSLVSYEDDGYGTTWLLAVSNDSANDYSLSLLDVVCDGKRYQDIQDYFGSSDNYVFAGEKTYVEVNCYLDTDEMNSITSKIAFMDIAQEEILTVSDTTVSWFVNGQPLQ